MLSSRNTFITMMQRHNDKDKIISELTSYSLFSHANSIIAIVAIF